jgi:nucleotide-binding universal stress UspA family protein
MYKNVLLAAALQRWEQYSAHALAARDAAAVLAGRAERLHVLTVYEYGSARLPASGVAPEMVARAREQEIQQTDALVSQRMDDYVAPLLADGLPVNRLLRVGSPRHVIVEVAQEVGADLIVIGSHSKRGFLDIALGGTARHVSTHAPCPVVMVAPKK